MNSFVKQDILKKRENKSPYEKGVFLRDIKDIWDVLTRLIRVKHTVLYEIYYTISS